MDRVAELTTVMEHALAPAQLELVEVTMSGGILRVVVDRVGGVNLDVLTDANEIISLLLDEQVDLAPSGSYQLEVSSPGLERPLRTPAHFSRAVGSDISVKTVAGTEGERRLQGTLSIADEEGILMLCDSGEVRRLAYGEISQARTTFSWGSSNDNGTHAPRTQARRSNGS
jgi:ribosome maturation factor RimP